MESAPAVLYGLPKHRKKVILSRRHFYLLHLTAPVSTASQPLLPWSAFSVSSSVVSFILDLTVQCGVDSVVQCGDGFDGAVW